MTYEFVTLTNQVTTAQWGWTIALFLWFIGLAGMSLVLNVWLRSKLVLVLGCGWDFVCAFALASPAQLADGCNQFVTRMEV